MSRSLPENLRTIIVICTVAITASVQFTHASDPVVYKWTKDVASGTSNDTTYIPARDSAGNVYVCGYYSGTVDFDPGSGTDSHTANAGNDIYLAKYSKDGVFQWVKTFGGSGSDEICYVVAVDSSDNIYLGGYFQTTVDFDPTAAGEDSKTVVGSRDLYLTKYSSDGTYQWTKATGGSGNDLVVDIVTDSDGYIYTVGQFSTTVDFDPSAGGSDSKTVIGGLDAYLSKYSSNGTYQWTKAWGSSQNEGGSYLALWAGSPNYLYVASSIRGTTDLDPSASNEDSHTTNGQSDVTLSKFSTDGDYQWGVSFGGTDLDYSQDIDLDASGNVYVAGQYGTTVDFDPSAETTSYTSQGNYDTFLSKFSSDGTFQWVRVPGSSGADKGNAVEVVGDGDIYFAGYFSNTIDFDPGTATDSKTSNGSYDVFLTKYSSDNTYQWTRTFGGTGLDTILGIAPGTNGSLYLAGYFNSTVDFDPSSDTDNLTSGGAADGYLTKYIDDESSPTDMKFGTKKDKVYFSSAKKSFIVNDRKIKLYFDTSELETSVTNVMVSEHSDFDGASWHPYDGDLSFKLSSGDEKKKLYIKFKDEALNESDVYKETIKLDTTAPDLKLEKIGDLLFDMDRVAQTIYISDTSPVFSGTSENKSDIKLYDNDTLVKEYPKITDERAKTWQISGYVFGKRTHKIKFTSTDQAGNTTELQFTLVV